MCGGDGDGGETGDGGTEGRGVQERDRTAGGIDGSTPAVQLKHSLENDLKAGVG